MYKYWDKAVQKYNKRISIDARKIDEAIFHKMMIPMDNFPLS